MKRGRAKGRDEGKEGDFRVGIRPHTRRAVEGDGKEEGRREAKRRKLARSMQVEAGDALLLGARVGGAFGGKGRVTDKNHRGVMAEQRANVGQYVFERIRI